jgi:hypothetical protein
MKPSANSIDLDKKLANRALKLLYKHYNAKHDTESSLDTFLISIINFHTRDISENFMAVVRDVQKLHNDFKSYTPQQMLSVTYNSLSRGGFMKTDNNVNYYLTPEGYRQGMKKLHFPKFMFKYHTNTTVIGAIALLSIGVTALVA